MHKYTNSTLTAHKYNSNKLFCTLRKDVLQYFLKKKLQYIRL